MTHSWAWEQCPRNKELGWELYLERIDRQPRLLLKAKDKSSVHRMATMYLSLEIDRVGEGP